MNIRELDYISVPVTDLEQALRFYHEVFDLKIIDLPNGNKGAWLNKQYLDFVETKQADHRPVKFGLIAKDKMSAVESHLINYDVNIISGPALTSELNRKASQMVVTDLDHNVITISVYE